MKTGHKKVLTILLLLLTTVMLSSATKSPYFSKSVVITRVYPHKLGYLVYYMANNLENKKVYLPMSLFKEQDGGERERSRLFTGYDKTYPYMAIFWKDGVFSHVKLYLKQDYKDVSWGALVDPDSHDQYFGNTDLEFDFE